MTCDSFFKDSLLLKVTYNCSLMFTFLRHVYTFVFCFNIAAQNSKP